MPELPEVHTISTDLNKYLTGYTIEKVAIAPKYNVLPDNQTFVKGVIGKKVINVHRIGKNILIYLDSGMAIKTHLAMTGRLLLREKVHGEDRWVRVLFLVSKYAVEKHLRYTDMRMFGNMELLDRVNIEKLKNSIGINLLDDTLNTDRFLENIKSIRTNIKNILLNQRIFSGLGNIYANESLFEAKLHPELKTTEIDYDKADRLLTAIRKVLNKGIEHRGSTLKDKMYVDIFGKEGNFQNHFKVYGKKICNDCKGKITYIKLNGRGTYFCPNCQPESMQRSLITDI